MRHGAAEQCQAQREAGGHQGRWRPPPPCDFSPAVSLDGERAHRLRVRRCQFCPEGVHRPPVQNPLRAYSRRGGARRAELGERRVVQRRGIRRGSAHRVGEFHHLL